MWLEVASPSPLQDTGWYLSSSGEPTPPTMHRKPRGLLSEEGHRVGESTRASGQ